MKGEKGNRKKGAMIKTETCIYSSKVLLVFKHLLVRLRNEHLMKTDTCIYSSKVLLVLKHLIVRLINEHS